ncbi:helix-turn-helix domain-containing protein [Nocardia sp. NPDC004568]|uniref:IclR family transcriptional regulator n=1 Tax=Nocardia sp. NPDC004568 TaxID=3154551 RepID=UPI0033AC0F19
MPTTNDNHPQTVMGRVLLLLEPFRESAGLTLTELAARTGLPRSSAHRMLLQLVGVGWLRRHGATYHLGPKMVELGSLAQNYDRVHRAAVAAMYQLHRRTGSAVHLAVLEGDELLYLEKIGGRWAAAVLPTHAGQRRSARETTDGAALLACRDGGAPAVREHVAGQDRGEPVHCVAVAFNAGHGEIAALSLTGPAGRMPESAVRDLVAAAGLVAARLGAPSGLLAAGGPSA